MHNLDTTHSFPIHTYPAYECEGFLSYSNILVQKIDKISEVFQKTFLLGKIFKLKARYFNQSILTQMFSNPLFYEIPTEKAGGNVFTFVLSYAVTK